MKRTKQILIISLILMLGVILSARASPAIPGQLPDEVFVTDSPDIFLPFLMNTFFPPGGPVGYGRASLPDQDTPGLITSVSPVQFSPTSPIHGNNVRAAGGPGTGTQAEISMASSGSSIVITFNGGPNGAGFVTSTDGGETFSALASPPVPAGSNPCCDPAVVADLIGRFYFVQLFRDDGANTPNAGNCTNSLHVSTDGGQTFSNIISSPFSFPPGGADFPDQPHVGIDRANLVGGQPQLYVFGRHFTSGINCPQTGGSGNVRGEVVCSTDGGVNWSAPIVLAPFTDTAHFGTASDGSVYIVGNGTGTNTGTRILLRRSTNDCNGGLNFGAPVTVADDLTFGPTGIDREFPQPYVVADRQDPNIAYVAWSSDRLTNDGDRDIFLARCTFAGTAGSCTAPIRVNDNPAGDGTAQYFPMMCIDPNNTINISWNDQRAGGNSTSIFHTEITPTGGSFGVGPNYLTSDISFTPVNFGGTPDYGDYNENNDACDASHFYASWTSQVSPPGILPASNDPDVFFAAINNLSDIRIRASLGFSDLCVGSSQVRQLEIYNTGDAPLQINNVSRFAGSSDITVDPEPTLPLFIDAGSHVNFGVTCAPTSLGTKSAVIRIESDDRDRPIIDLTATCNVAEQDINISLVDEGDFGNVCMESQGDMNLQVFNQGRCDLQISDITSTNPDNFSLPASLQFPLILSPNASVDVPVRFQPNAAGQTCSDTVPRTGEITISSDDPDEPVLSQMVSGMVPCPEATTSGAINFDGLCTGDIQEETVQVCNTGYCNMRVIGASLVGPDCDDLTLVSPSPPPTPEDPLVISSDFCFNFVIRFEPDDPIAPTCSLEVLTDDPDNATITMPVEATMGGATLVLDPPNLMGVYAFPPTVTDPYGLLGCYSERNMILRNVGSCPAEIADINTGGSTAFDVIAPTVFPINLNPGEEFLGVTVRFAPPSGGGSVTAPDETVGVLSVVSSDPGGGVVGQVCGEAVVQSGGRWLVVDGSGSAIASVDRISLRSYGIHQPSPISITLTDVPPSAATICGNPILYHLNREDLPPAGTTGVNPNSSYRIEAKEGNSSVIQSFVLGQCEFKQEVLWVP